VPDLGRTFFLSAAALALILPTRAVACDGWQVRFQDGSSRLSASERQNLSRFVAEARRLERLDRESVYRTGPFTPYRYRIDGYGDWRGPAAGNVVLARRRARAVRAALIRLGLPSSITSIGPSAGTRGPDGVKIAFGSPGEMCGGG
jgi:hypothetical protein